MVNTVTKVVKRTQEVLESICCSYSNGYKPHYPWDAGKEGKVHKTKKV